MEKRLSEAPYFAGSEYFHRRYRDLSVASRERAKRNRLGGVPPGQEVVRRNRRAPSRAARAEGARRCADYASRTVRSESTRDPVRRDAISASLREIRRADKKGESILSTRLRVLCLSPGWGFACMRRRSPGTGLIRVPAPMSAVGSIASCAANCWTRCWPGGVRSWAIDGACKQSPSPVTNRELRRRVLKILSPFIIGSPDFPQ